MADDESPGDSNPFDVQIIKQLVALMGRHDLSVIDLRQGDARICLRRGAAPMRVPEVVLAPSPIGVPAPAAAAPQATPSPDAPAKNEAASRSVHIIKSPMVGTFYSREKPEADPYVKVGSRVTATTVVGLIEAMKLFNEIQAECTGVIVEVLVDNAQPVHYDMPLFKVDLTA